MHEHKQNQCKRKVKHRKNVMGLIIFCITVGLAFMFTYYQNLRKEISARQKWLETVLTGEKKWILENQGPEGEIYMNGSKAGDVNPYFACMAALGLLAETKNCPITETEKKAVDRYLDWHSGILLETDGKMGIYRKESGKLIYKEKADSEDGYLGMYLFLMGKYPLYTGEAGWICMECEKLYGLYERKIKTARRCQKANRFTSAQVMVTICMWEKTITRMKC